MSATGVNERIVLARRVRGLPEAEDFRFDRAPLPALEAGQVLVRHSHLGLAPAAWIRMSEETAGYPMRTEIGEPVYGSAYGVVVESRDETLPVGTRTISIDGGWQNYAVADRAGLTAVDSRRAPAEAWLGVLGVSGFTAWSALRIVGAIAPGETVVISSAAGAVGSAAVQFARRHGCRVVGIAGSRNKCEIVRDVFGADECVDHSAPNFAEALAAAVGRDGVDVYLDNVGGHVRDAVWPHLRARGRVVVCGQISAYSTSADDPGPNWYPVMTKSLRIEGINWSHHWHLFGDFIEEIAPAVADGSIQFRERVVHGLDKAPAAFRQLLEGAHTGKVIVKID